MRSDTESSTLLMALEGQTTLDLSKVDMSKSDLTPISAAAKEKPVAVCSLREFFHDSVQQAMRKHHVEVDAHTEHYVVNILTMFARSEDLYDRTPDGPKLRPLAHMLADAAAAHTREQQQSALRRLGDVSLFIAGFFAQSFARKLIDVDYHIAMGGRAYGTLADSVRVKGLAEVFAELARKFQRLVDVLNEVAETSHVHSHRDVLRQYEIWLKTGSPRARGILEKLGVAPVLVASAHGH